jgi:nucleoside-diphosphate-sugar epimerase
MRILLAGGSGLLGRRVLPLLLHAGHHVSATSRSAARAAELDELGASGIVMDALDRDSVALAVELARPDVVVDLLTDLRGGDSGSNAALRTTGTRHLVDAVAAHGIGRMVAESISWIYRPGTVPAVESDALDLDAGEPRRTTVAGVRALEEAVAELPDGVVLRFGQVYGPGTWYSRDGRFGEQARGGSAAGPLAAADTVASFVHLDDAARAVVTALDWPSGTVNVVDDEPAAGAEWAPAFAEAVGAGASAGVVGAALSGDPGRPVSNARATSLGLSLEHPTWRDGFGTL